MIYCENCGWKEDFWTLTYNDIDNLIENLRNLKQRMPNFPFHVDDLIDKSEYDSEFIDNVYALLLKSDLTWFDLFKYEIQKSLYQMRSRKYGIVIILIGMMKDMKKQRMIYKMIMKQNLLK